MPGCIGFKRNQFPTIFRLQTTRFLSLGYEHKYIEHSFFV